MQKVSKQEVIENIAILKLKQDQEADLLNDLSECEDAPWELFQVLSDYGDVEVVCDDGLIYCNGNNDAVFEYLNAGDTYASTFIYDNVRKTLYLTTIGDCIEYAQQYGLTACGDDSDYHAKEIKHHVDLYGSFPISHGTLRNEDLIPALVSFCIRLNPETARDWFGNDAYAESFEYWKEDCDLYQDHEKASDYLDNLYNCLDSILQGIGLYVGSVEGDPTDICIFPLKNEADKDGFCTCREDEDSEWGCDGRPYCDKWCEEVNRA